MPGSEFRFVFRLPDEHTDYELFVRSTGYYLEWMRGHWYADKDLPRLYDMLFRTKKYLRQEAPRYKCYERQMEQEFWNSKVDTKTFSYDEN